MQTGDNVIGSVKEKLAKRHLFKLSSANSSLCWAQRDDQLRLLPIIQSNFEGFFFSPPPFCSWHKRAELCIHTNWRFGYFTRFYTFATQIQIKCAGTKKKVVQVHFTPNEDSTGDDQTTNIPYKSVISCGPIIIVWSFFFCFMQQRKGWKLCYIPKILLLTVPGIHLHHPAVNNRWRSLN